MFTETMALLFAFAVAGHWGNPENITALADAFCQPMHTFITEKHKGALGKDYSLVKLNNDAVRITAVKKAQDSDKIILRVAECSGIDQSGVDVEFSEAISEAYEIRGDETVIGKTEVTEKIEKVVSSRTRCCSRRNFRYQQTVYAGKRLR